LENEAVTVRDRDTWEQERIKVAELADYLQRRLKAESPVQPTAATSNLEI
jgi:glycyl-tRNA synthetase (class II)